MLVRHDALVAVDSCVNSVPRVLADGSVRWFGSRARRLDTSAGWDLRAPA